MTKADAKMMVKKSILCEGTSYHHRKYFKMAAEGACKGTGTDEQILDVGRLKCQLSADASLHCGLLTERELCTQQSTIKYVE